ncbi:hypothetical protein C2845_PM14G05890 [Panicum miliaceum]|uniref:Uncharacterized protein n=1 Tax=Panicum miliaceum TaxID=4540 RepID=A0A3L6PNF5_PANMI|nr:hypothetical protein C2845_PM14G05890 [Panicum miliaceum]
MGYTGGLKRVRVEAPMMSRVCDPPEVTREDAAGEPKRYEEVFAVMRAFKAESINTDGVVDRMKVLLSGHPELIHAFNQFLPWAGLHQSSLTSRGKPHRHRGKGGRLAIKMGKWEAPNAIMEDPF